jgi:stearoyl-CoA desaturase (Delta-9 desaturase)
MNMRTVTLLKVLSNGIHQIVEALSFSFPYKKNSVTVDYEISLKLKTLDLIMIEKKEINWGRALFLIIYQSLLLAILPFYLYFSMPSWTVWLCALILLYLTGIGITGGYHRLYSHRAYKTNKPVEAAILFFATMSLQGSALRWAFDHRLHHAHVDTDEDPYSIKKGFWYAHCLWIWEKPKTIDPKVVPDLLKNRLIVLQDRYYEVLAIASNVFVCIIMGWLLNDYWGAFFIITWLRIFALHHFTWFINSLAHTWGDKPFCQEQTAVNNYILAMLTFGEGYHNYHHVFANDYRNGIRWYHFDPTKWVIWTLSKLGLAHSLKRMDPTLINRRLVIERKNLLMEQLKEMWHVKTDELSKKVDEISERIVQQLARFNQLKEAYRQIKREHQRKDHLLNLKREIRSLKKSIRQDWRLWVQLSKDIMKMKPIPT